ncbi:MAG TPA: MATE family efflux transporter [Acidobacteriota bacterium]|nr:MATE family efflux transporter [Acidobacteriota bacterium]
MEATTRNEAPKLTFKETFKIIRDAVKGDRREDYTSGTLGRDVLLLAVPMVLEVCLESVFAVVNIFWVSRLGAAATAAVGLTEAMLSILYALAMGLCMGATAIVARRIGEKNPDAAAVAGVQAIILGIFVSFVIAIVGGMNAERLLGLMGASSEVVIAGTSYTRIMLLGNGTILLLFLINAIFRGAGDAAIAMRCLWLGNIINLILDPCFIFGLGFFPELGVTGAAVATTTARGTAVLYQFYRLSRKDSRVVIHRQNLRLDPPVMFTMIRISGTGILQSLINTTSWIGLIRILSGFGSAAVAGYTVGIRIVLFAILPSWGMSNAAATLVGQNLGAKKPERAESAVWLTCRYNLFFLGAICLLFEAFAGPLIRAFTSDPSVAMYGINCLRIVSAGFIFYAFGMVLTQAFNGAGDTWTPTMINLLCFWLWEIPLGYYLATKTQLGPSGVFAAITIAFSTLAVISALLFKKGKWKVRKV